MTGEEPASVVINRGGLYVSRDVYDRYFAGLESVVLLRRADDLLMLPVRLAAAGGYLLKLRTSAGDRVVTAPDFFRSHGVPEDVRREFVVTWNADQAGLIAAGFFV